MESESIWRFVCPVTSQDSSWNELAWNAGGVCLKYHVDMKYNVYPFAPEICVTFDAWILGLDSS